MKTTSKRLFWGLGAMAALSPLAIVIACGEDVNTNNQNAVARAADASFSVEDLKPTATSTHDKVAWEGRVTLQGADAAQYVVTYLSGNVVTQSDTVLATGWSSELPTSVAFVKTERHLWARAVLRPGVTAIDKVYDPVYFDLTGPSGVQTIKSNVNAASVLATGSLDKVTLVGTAYPNFSLGGLPNLGTLPLTTEVRFDDGTWVKTSDFASELARWAATYVSGSPVKVEVRYNYTGSNTDYAYTPVPPKTLDSTALVAALTLPGFNAGTLSLDPSSTHSSLKWTGSVALTGTNADKYKAEYLGTTLATPEAASRVGGWSGTLPAVTSSTPSERHFYVRLTPVTGAPVNPSPVLDASNLLSNVKVALVAVDATLDQAALIGTTYPNFSLSGLPNLGALPLEVQVRFNERPWVKASDFATELATWAATYEAGTEAKVELRLNLNGSAEGYAYTPTDPKTLDTTALVSALTLPSFSLDTLSLDPTSTDTRLVWTGSVSLTGTNADKYKAEYLGTTLASVEAAKLASGWSDLLPGTTSSTPSDRHFYVRLAPRVGTLAKPSPVLDASSLLALAKVAVVVPTGASLDNAALTGDTYPNFTLTGLPNLSGQPLKVEVRFDDRAWVNATDFATELAAWAGAYTPGNTAKVEVRLNLSGSTDTYAFTPTTPKPLDTTALVTALSSPTLALGDLGLATTSTHTNLSWTGSVSINGTNADKYKAEYLSTTVASVDVAKLATGWTDTLPSSTSATPSERHLFVRYALKTGTLAKASDVLDASSLLNIAKVNVNELTEVKAATLSNVQLVSYKLVNGARTLALSDVPSFGAAPVVLQFSFDGGVSYVDYTSDLANLNTAVASFVTSRVDRRVTPTFKTRLVLTSAGTTSSSLADSKETTLTLSAAFLKDLYDAAPEYRLDLASLFANNWSPLVVTPGASGVKGRTDLTAELYESYKAKYDTTNGANLVGEYKLAVSGFEYLGGQERYVGTKEQVASVTTSPDYSKLDWAWTSDTEQMQWAEFDITAKLGADPANLHVWARAKLTDAKNYVVAENFFDISEASNVVYSGTTSAFGISREDMDLAEAFVNQYYVLTSASTSTNLVWAPLPSEDLWPAALRDRKLVVTYLSTESLNEGKYPVETAPNRAHPDASLRGLKLYLTPNVPYLIPNAKEHNASSPDIGNQKGSSYFYYVKDFTNELKSLA